MAKSTVHPSPTRVSQDNQALQARKPWEACLLLGYERLETERGVELEGLGKYAWVIDVLLGLSYLLQLERGTEKL